MIVIVDYGVGNLFSLKSSFEAIGTEIKVSGEPEDIRQADKIVLPGVGAFRDAREKLGKNGLDQVIVEETQKGKPLLGICLGMQMLFEKSYEYGEHEGLSLLKGEIRRLPDTVKIPHMGWNCLSIQMRSPLFEGLEEEPYVYFVHSYYLQTEAPIVSATTYYGKQIQVAAQKDNIFALQFHPEKSGDVGLKILENFGRI